MRRVLITSRSFGQVSDEPLNLLTGAGFEVDFYNVKYEEKEFIQKLSGCDALIIGAHQLTEEAVAAALKLKVVSKHGTGLDNIDLDVTKKYKIHVTNVPAANSNAVADLAFSLMLDVARKTSYASNKVKKGQWPKVIGVDVYGKTLSLIGFGEIGKCVARRARGFSMNILAYDPYIKNLPDEFNFVKLATFEEALGNADFLSVHVPLTSGTRGLIGKNELKMMKKGSFIINTSRGGIVSEDDLIESIEKGHTTGAGLDVLETEPISVGSRLAELDQVTITPHIGMYSHEALNKVSMVAAQNVIEFFEKHAG